MLVSSINGKTYFNVVENKCETNLSVCLSVPCTLFLISMFSFEAWLRTFCISETKMQFLHPNQIFRRRRRQLNLDIPSAAIAKGKTTCKPNICKPNVGGDSFSMLDQGSVYSFSQHVNIQQLSIRFTTKTENYSKITFDPRFARGPCRRPPYIKRLQDSNTTF